MLKINKIRGGFCWSWLLVGCGCFTQSHRAQNSWFISRAVFCGTFCEQFTCASFVCFSPSTQTCITHYSCNSRTVLTMNLAQRLGPRVLHCRCLSTTEGQTINLCFVQSLVLNTFHLVQVCMPVRDPLFSYDKIHFVFMVI